MKKIILILLSITIFSSANSVIKDCANKYYNSTERDRCFTEYLKRILKPYNRSVKLITIINNKIPSNNNIKKKFWQIATLRTEKKANNFIEKNIVKLNHFKIYRNDIRIRESWNYKKNRFQYSVLCLVNLNNKRKKLDFKKLYHGTFIPNPQPRRDTYSAKQPRRDTYSAKQPRRDTYSAKQPRRDTYPTQQQSITHDINTMCIDLEKNYNKFNRRPNVEYRIINRARQKFEECKRTRQDLINIQRR